MADLGGKRQKPTEPLSHTGSGTAHSHQSSSPPGWFGLNSVTLAALVHSNEGGCE